ncbi:MAG: Steroid Delta-isomerase [Acidimicrobiales bacterium]|nr:Steroid Delta-isomerase [Acidimicrobiales bacterium]
MPEAEQMREVVGRYIAANTAGDVDAIVALYAPDATVEDPIGSEPHQGHDAIRSFYESTQALADEVELVSTGPVRVAANEVAFPFQVISRLGETKVVLDVVDTMKFDETGKVTEMRAYWSMNDIRPFEG